MWFEWAVLASGLFFVLFTMTRHDSTTGAHASEQRTRSWLLSIVRGRPGIRLVALWKAAGVSRGTAQYHVSVLSNAGLVRIVRQGQESRIFPLVGGEEDLDAVGILLRVGILALVDLIRRQPGPTTRDCSESLGLAPKTTRRYANVLEKAGLVEEVWDQGKKRYYSTPKLDRVRGLVSDRENGEGSSHDGRASAGTGQTTGSRDRE